MSTLQLNILSPSHQATFVGPVQANVTFQGEVIPDESTPNQLFFDWYSSLNTDADDPALDNRLRFTRSLAMGSHVITLTAKDRPGNALEDLQTVTFAEMAGGPEEAEHPCVIHVLIANMLLPTNNSNFDPASDSLAAEAPIQWGRERENRPDDYEPNPDYLAINRIQYHWRLTPRGNPSRPTIEIRPTPEQLIFATRQGNQDIPNVRYSGPFPRLFPGPYRLTLRVEDRKNPTIGHETSTTITVI